MPAATSRTVGAAHRAPARLPIAAWLLALLAVAGCSRDGERPAAPAGEALRPALLLVTLDTTRADAVAPEAPAADTPALARLAASAVRFTQAYAPAPMTLPAHASLMTGLYPAGHGVHENARALAAGHPLVAERLRQAGYATAAFVSAFPLDRQFGLARGFDLYDDELGAGREERPAAETTARALAWLDGTAGGPTFLWVHYFDPHAPYEPPEPFGSRFPDDPYRGEVAAMDQQLGRLLDAFAARYGDHRILVVGDHGEGLGEHGEAQHGNLLYQGVMRVPLLLAGSGLAPRVVAHPVSTRRVHDTLLAWAGLDGPASLLSAAADAEPVLGEAMTPFLQYGWQPQVMAVSGRLKAIHAGRLEIYDVVADPGEGRDLAAEARLDRAARQALREYPLPDATPAAPPVDDEARQRLASLGYVAAEGRPPPREGAPRPADMAYLFADLDRGSGHFVREEYAAAIPVFERVAAQDPGNLMVAVRLAVSHSLLGRDEEALRWFRRAEGIDGESLDLRHYLGQHHLRAGRFEQAAPLLEAVVAAAPQRLPALEGLARVRERQGRLDEAAALVERLVALDRAPAAELLRLGELRMAAGRTAQAIAAFERARALQGEAFNRHLELGVLYLADRRLAEAAVALDRVPPGHPGYPMALFKRAQVSVLLGEPDRGERVRRATAHADATTAPLIARETLFADRR